MRTDRWRVLDESLSVNVVDAIAGRVETHMRGCRPSNPAEDEEEEEDAT